MKRQYEATIIPMFTKKLCTIRTYGLMCQYKNLVPHWKYLVKFFRNLLLGENNELKNRYMLIGYKDDENAPHTSSIDIQPSSRMLHSFKPIKSKWRITHQSYTPFDSVLLCLYLCVISPPRNQRLALRRWDSTGSADRLGNRHRR